MKKIMLSLFALLLGGAAVSARAESVNVLIQIPGGTPGTTLCNNSNPGYFDPTNGDIMFSAIPSTAVTLTTSSSGTCWDSTFPYNPTGGYSQEMDTQFDEAAPNPDPYVYSTGWVEGGTVTVGYAYTYTVENTTACGAVANDTNAYCKVILTPEGD